MDAAFIAGALRFFPGASLFIVAFHWILHRYGGDRDPPSRSSPEANPKYRRVWYVLFCTLVAILATAAPVNLSLSGRAVLVAGLAETIALMICVAVLCVLLLTPWGAWFAGEAQRWSAFRCRIGRLQRPMLISSAFALLCGLFAVLVAIASALAEAPVDQRGR